MVTPYRRNSQPRETFYRVLIGRGGWGSKVCSTNWASAVGWGWRCPYLPSDDTQRIMENYNAIMCHLFTGGLLWAMGTDCEKYLREAILLHLTNVINLT